MIWSLTPSVALCRFRQKIINCAHRYDSGSVEGSVIRERVLVGGMAVNGVEMGLVRRQEKHIRGFKADGIVGLAFPSISTTQNTSPSQHSTFVQLLQEQFGAVGDLFSVYLTREWERLGGCSASRPSDTASLPCFLIHLWIIKKNEYHSDLSYWCCDPVVLPCQNE